MGILWTRLLASLPNTTPSSYTSNSSPGSGNSDNTTLSQASPFADTLGAFSTISQEKRHESLPSWIFEEESVRRMWNRAYTLLDEVLRVHPQFHVVEKFLSLEQFLLHLGTSFPNSNLLLLSIAFSFPSFNFFCLS